MPQRLLMLIFESSVVIMATDGVGSELHRSDQVKILCFAKLAYHAPLSTQTRHQSRIRFAQLSQQMCQSDPIFGSRLQIQT
jgi:hypothetical protein